MSKPKKSSKKKKSSISVKSYLDSEFAGINGIEIGRPIENGEMIDAEVKIPLLTLTMHGMVGGSTGTGKSRAIQLMAEELADSGIPVLL